MKLEASFLVPLAASLSLSLSLVIGGGPAAAQTTSRPIRVISTFPTGIVPDMAMRVLADQVTKQTGQQVFVDPQPGGNGFIAISALKQSPADGQTLLLVSNAHLAIIPALVANAPYRVESDFASVAMIYRAPFFLAVPAESKYQNVGQLVAGAKAADQRVSYSIPYMGAPNHLGIGTFESLVGAKMLAVPYKDGGVMAVAKGEVDFTLMALGSARPLVDSGKVKVLAIATPQRSDLMPEVPTLEEAGGPKGVNAQTYVGLVAPRGTPSGAIQRLNEEFNRALQSPELVERFNKVGVSVMASTPEQMSKLVQDDAAATIELVKRTGIRGE